MKRVARRAMRDSRHLREAAAAFVKDGRPKAGELTRVLKRAERATDFARGPAHDRAPPRLQAKFYRRFDRIVAGEEKCCAKLPDFESARAGKRGPKKRRAPGNFPRLVKKRKKETLPFICNLSVPSLTARPSAIFG